MTGAIESALDDGQVEPMRAIAVSVGPTASLSHIVRDVAVATNGADRRGLRSVRPSGDRGGNMVLSGAVCLSN